MKYSWCLNQTLEWGDAQDIVRSDRNDRIKYSLRCLCLSSIEIDDHGHRSATAVEIK